MKLQRAPALTGTPVLKTERLVLRAPLPADWPAFRAFAASERTAFVGGTKSESDAFQKFAGFIGQWPLRGFGRFILTDRATGLALGHAGPMQLSDDAVPELTWSLWSAEHEGRGFAFEAASAVNRWTFGALALTEAKAEVHRDNHASHALVRKLGGTVWPGVTTGWFPDGTVYRFTAGGAA